MDVRTRIAGAPLGEHIRQRRFEIPISIKNVTVPLSNALQKLCPRGLFTVFRELWRALALI